MKRSVGKAGRPFGHLSINALEIHARTSPDDLDELTVLLSELGHRKTRRAAELRELIVRLRRTAAPEPKEKP